MWYGQQAFIGAVPCFSESTHEAFSSGGKTAELIVRQSGERHSRLPQLNRPNSPVFLDPGQHAVELVENAVDDLDQCLHPHYGWAIPGLFGEFASRESPLGNRSGSCPLFLD